MFVTGPRLSIFVTGPAAQWLQRASCDPLPVKVAVQRPCTLERYTVTTSYQHFDQRTCGVCYWPSNKLPAMEGECVAAYKSSKLLQEWYRAEEL